MKLFYSFCMLLLLIWHIHYFSCLYTLLVAIYILLSLTGYLQFFSHLKNVGNLKCSELLYTSEYVMQKLSFI